MPRQEMDISMLHCGACCGTQSFANDFEKIFSCRANGIVPVTKYISKSSGLQVVHAEIEGPTVNGYFAIAVRPFDDDGLPHTLEHLVFLGSEDYPYKGVLDRLANKCLASGTNAWTDVDHTCYTLDTAGSEGFCALLPVYLDHIFYPLLSENAFKTEIHHVTGKGTDGGVVYSEIQALENTSYEKSMNELLKALYPPKSGYHYNVGGCLANLRNTCTNEKVKLFHKEYYHPHNASIIVCGQINPAKIFTALGPILRKFSKRDAYVETWEKPWIREDIPELTEPRQKIITFSTDDVDCGTLITIGMLGPSIIYEYEEAQAVLILIKYLTSGSSSPIQQEFVEKQDGMASSVEINILTNLRPAYCFEFEGVTGEDSDQVVTLLRKVLERQMQQFDMQRMKDTINANIQAEYSNIENNPHFFIARSVIEDFIYGSEREPSSSLERRLNGISILQALLQRTESFWKNLLQERILAQHWVTIYAEPSQVYRQELIKMEETRITNRIIELGDEGLQKLAYELDEAIIMNSRSIPSKILRKVRVPSIRSIECHKISRMINPSWAAAFPANLCIDNISTSFFYVGVLMDTSRLSDDLRRYLPLFRELILNSPIFLDGTRKVIPFEQVAAMRYRDLQLCEMNLGLEKSGGEECKFSCGNFSHLLALSLQIEILKVEEGMDWIRKILWNTKWDTERIKICVSKMITDIYVLRREGHRMCQGILKDIIYRDKTNMKSSGILQQLHFLRSLEELLTSPSCHVTTALDTILNLITQPDNVSVHIATNISKLREAIPIQATKRLPVEAWLAGLLQKCFPFGVTPAVKRLASCEDTVWMVPFAEIENDPMRQVILGLSSEDSAYLVMVAPGPTSFMNPDLPALLTTLQYFTQLEGPLYQKIRGHGHAYSFNLVANVCEGLIYLHLIKCSDLIGAYAAVGYIFKGFFYKTLKWSDELLVSAKNSLIFECLETEKTPVSLASNSLLAYYRNVPGTFWQELVYKIRKVRMSDVKRIFKKYVLSLLSNKYACCVVCPVNQVESLRSGLEKLGRKLVVGHSFDEFSRTW